MRTLLNPRFLLRKESKYSGPSPKKGFAGKQYLCIEGRHETTHKGQRHLNKVITNPVVKLEAVAEGFILTTTARECWFLAKPPT